MSKASKEWSRAYYRDHYSTPSVHQSNQRVVPPADIERREFHEPCFKCGDRGGCRHRRSQMAESNRESATA